MATLAAEQWGVLSTEELRRCGLDAQAISVRARNGRLHRLHRGVYAVGHSNPSLEGRLLAAVKACGPDAVLSHVPAAVLWGILDRPRDPDPEVTVIGQSHRAHAGIRVHRSITLKAAEVSQVRGVPVTSASRTVLDLASVLDERSLRGAVRRAVGLRLVQAGDVVRTVTAAGRRPGVPALRRIVADGLATRSELEDVVLRLIVDGGLVRPEVNVPLSVSGRTVIPDFRWPAQRLIVEADGAAWHDHPVARREDVDRQRLLEGSGETVIRVSWRQAVGDPARTLRRLLHAGAPQVR